MAVFIADPDALDVLGEERFVGLVLSGLSSGVPFGMPWWTAERMASRREWMERLAQTKDEAERAKLLAEMREKSRPDEAALKRRREEWEAAQKKEVEAREARRGQLQSAMAESGKVSGLSVTAFGRVEQVARVLGVPPEVVRGWRLTWVSEGGGWREMSASALLGLVQALERDAKADPGAGAAVDKVWDHALARAGQDEAWLLGAVESGLLDRGLSRLDEGQRARLAAALGSCLRSQPEAAAIRGQSVRGQGVRGQGVRGQGVRGQSVRGLERLRLLAARLELPRQDMARWTAVWLAEGEAWRKLKGQGALRALWLLEHFEGDADLRGARGAVLDDVLASAGGEPGWFGEVVQRDWALLVQRFWGQLIQDERYKGDDAREQALATVLNAAGPWSMWGVTRRADQDGEEVTDINGLSSPWQGRQWRFSAYSGGQFGHGGVWTTLAVVLEEGLRRGVIEPRPTTLALLAHQELRLIGHLADWKVYLDGQIGASEVGSERWAQWMLGRGYAEELSGGRPQIERGEPWVLGAYLEAEEEGLRGGLLAVAAAQLALGERFAEAEALVKEAEAGGAVGAAGASGIGGIQPWVQGQRRATASRAATLASRENKRISASRQTAEAERARRRRTED